MPAFDVPDRDGYFDRWSELHLGYDPRGAFWPRTWLTLTYYCAKPLVRLGVAPDAITLAGGAISAAVPVLALAGGRWLLLAVAVIVASGLVDNLDGAVAAMTGRATPLGYVLDSVVDRVSDGCYLLALWLAGAPAWVCVLGGVVTMLHEYIRARAIGAGMSEVGTVTVSERPTRVIVTAFALCGAGVLPARAALAVTVGAAAWLALGTVGLGQVAVAVRRTLRPGRSTRP
ncbi:MAG: CDP-alcohol phosphatidyltransferase family protein [Actinomycetota bacterium]|nr:CDP-alcohol phosphatidyltransferase family protein [Actinomycetota bacterium]